MRINIYVLPLPFYLIILQLSSATKFQLSWATHAYASWITSRRKKHCNQTDGAVPVVIMGGRNCPNILVSNLDSSFLELSVDFFFINSNPFPPRLLPCGLCWSSLRRAHEFLLAYKPRMSELIAAAFHVVIGSTVLDVQTYVEPLADQGWLAHVLNWDWLKPPVETVTGT